MLIMWWQNNITFILIVIYKERKNVEKRETNTKHAEHMQLEMLANAPFYRI